MIFGIGGLHLIRSFVHFGTDDGSNRIELSTVVHSYSLLMRSADILLSLGIIYTSLHRTHFHDTFPPLQSP
ncbi:hypothetical protein VTN49DRAFT_515 [Thermomyces lanuginosus]|uniref:uncharacterized protein n=1 Tax=Thermomyces lanuginosus TaxID=5541 RepID=UPI00374319B2